MTFINTILIIVTVVALIGVSVVFLVGGIRLLLHSLHKVIVPFIDSRKVRKRESK